MEAIDDHTGLPSGVILIKNLAIPVLTLIFLVGVVGNTLTVFVLRTKRLRQSSTAIYLTALAVVDILYLLSSLLIHIINYTFLFPNEVPCSLCPFLQYTLTYLSVWLIVAVTVDRAIWVTRPFQAKHICTKRNATYTVTVITLTLVCLDSHFFWTMHYGVSHHPAASNGECRSGPFTERIFPYIDLVLLLVIPFAFMLASNILIGWQLKKMRDFGRRRQQELSANLQCTTHEAPTHPQSIGSMAITAIIFGIERFVYTLWYTNFAVHFILYCLNGPPFRAKAMQLFKSRCCIRMNYMPHNINGKSNPRFPMTTLQVPQYSMRPSATDTVVHKPAKLVTLHAPVLEPRRPVQSLPDIVLEGMCDELPEIEGSDAAVDVELGPSRI
ncbi:unnamed protein product [Echinostoma caproni]|uniref:G_PROTEIN_RECEP_F1_2 domain-containing protein n=1 Tax=Echinostoma caproni TaxID=27848 RepID=A0A183A597_9TREM|nr:unnamed protein product [Echinostoma caproni]